MLKELAGRNRSYRRFHEEVAVTPRTLRELVELARLCGSTANRQSLRFLLSCEPATNARIFPHLAWAGYLKDWPGPDPGERPAAYIVIVDEKQLSMNNRCDVGITAQTILLGATEKGLGGCMLSNVRWHELRQELAINERYEPVLVIALGKPKETVVIDPVGVNGDIKYWRDAEGVHHVPKRALADIILKI